MHSKNGFLFVLMSWVMILGLSSCSKQSQHAGSYKNESIPKEAIAEQESIASAGDYADLLPKEVSENAVTSSTVGNTTHYTADGQKRQLLKTAQASFEVKNVYKAAITIEDMTANLGGFVTRNSIKNRESRSHSQRTSHDTVTIVHEYRPYAELTVRIPQAQVQTFLRGLIKHVEFMHGRHFDAKDVLLDILKQQQLARANAGASKSVGNAAQKDDELGDKVSAIESKVNYQQAKILAEIEKADLADKVAFSEINLTLQQPPMVRKQTEQSFEAVLDKVQPSFWYRIKNSFYDGWQSFLSFIVGVVNAWPFFIFFALLYAIWRWVRTRWKARKTKKTSKQESK